jgi:hypothetical protein
MTYTVAYLEIRKGGGQKSSAEGASIEAPKALRGWGLGRGLAPPQNFFDTSISKLRVLIDSEAHSCFLCKSFKNIHECITIGVNVTKRSQRKIIKSIASQSSELYFHK